MGLRRTFLKILPLPSSGNRLSPWTFLISTVSRFITLAARNCIIGGLSAAHTGARGRCERRVHRSKTFLSVAPEASSDEDAHASPFRALLRLPLGRRVRRGNIKLRSFNPASVPSSILPPDHRASYGTMLVRAVQVSEYFTTRGGSTRAIPSLSGACHPAQALSLILTVLVCV